MPLQSTLYKEGEPYELPAEFREKLHAALRRNWNESHESRRGTT